MLTKNNLIINKVSLQKRCDICHQTDTFNPSTSSCLRCSPVVSAIEQAKQAKIGQILADYTKKQKLHYDKQKQIDLSIVVELVLGNLLIIPFLLVLQSVSSAIPLLPTLFFLSLINISIVGLRACKKKYRHLIDTKINQNFSQLRNYLQKHKLWKKQILMP